MKRSLVGMVSVAILMVVTGVGFGIAQAEGTHRARSVSSVEDQDAPDALERSTTICHYEESSPVLSFEDQEDLVRDSERTVSDENRPVLSFDDQEVVHVTMLAQTTEICRSR